MVTSVMSTASHMKYTALLMSQSLCLKGGLSSKSSSAFFCSGGLLGELPLWRHDEVGIAIAVVAWVAVGAVVEVVEIVKVFVLANCSCKQDCW